MEQGLRMILNNFVRFSMIGFLLIGAGLILSARGREKDKGGEETDIPSGENAAEKRPGADRVLIFIGIVWILCSGAAAAGTAAFAPDSMPAPVLSGGSSSGGTFSGTASSGSASQKKEYTDATGLYTYTLDDQSIFATIRSYLGSETRIVIPNTLDGHIVTGISIGAFNTVWGASSLTVPGTIRNIPPACFLGCFNLKTLIIGEGVSSISMKAFALCDKLERVSLPESLARIDDDVFPEDCAAVFTVPAGSEAESWCLSHGFTVG